MIKEPKLTEWIAHQLPPARVGVYEVETHVPGMRWFRRWDGRFWYCGNDDLHFASKVAVRIAPGAERNWRGLAEPPQ